MRDEDEVEMRPRRWARLGKCIMNGLKATKDTLSYFSIFSFENWWAQKEAVFYRLTG